MDRAKLTAIERNGHWSVCIAWPNGTARYLGEYASKFEARDWIKEHQWLTTGRIEEKDLARRQRQSDRKKSQAG